MSKFEWFWDWCVGWEPSDKAMTKEPDEKLPSFYCDYCKSKMPCSAYNWGVECKEEVQIKENNMKNPRFKRRYYKGEDYVMFSLYCDEGTTQQGELRMQSTDEGLKLIAYNDSFGLLHEFQDVFKFSLENVSMDDFVKLLEGQGFKSLYN